MIIKSKLNNYKVEFRYKINFNFFKSNQNSIYIIDRIVYKRFNLKKFKLAVDQGVTPIILDNTNIMVQYMQPYAEYAKKNDYKIIIKFRICFWVIYSKKFRTHTFH